jgi:hypothetical protein
MNNFSEVDSSSLPWDAVLGGEKVQISQIFTFLNPDLVKKNCLFIHNIPHYLFQML